MKTIAIKIGATEAEPIDVNIEPGTTSADILEHIKRIKGMDLGGYALSKENGQNQFALTENVYPKVENGEKLYAFQVSKVGQ